MTTNRNRTLNSRRSRYRLARAASMMMSCPPKKNAVRDESLSAGISSTNRLLSAQSKCCSVNTPHRELKGAQWNSRAGCSLLCPLRTR